MNDQLLPLSLPERRVHLCVDMQRIFSTEGPWPTPWMDGVVPVAAALDNHHPERTVFTRFIPPEHAHAALSQLLYGTDRDRRCRNDPHAVGMIFDPSSGVTGAAAEGNTARFTPGGGGWRRFAATALDAAADILAGGSAAMLRLRPNAPDRSFDHPMNDDRPEERHRKFVGFSQMRRKPVCLRNGTFSS
jgi:hypothetical protein